MTFSTVRRSTRREWSKPLSISTSGVEPVSRPANASEGLFSGTISLMFSFSGVLVTSAILDIQILYELCVGLNKVFTQLNFCSHQFVKNCIRLLGVGHFYLHKYTLLGVHSGFEQLFGIHFTQTLVALLL